MEHSGAQAACVYAVVVCFNPERQNLRHLVDALLPQAAHVLLVDNGSDASARGWLEALNGPRTELVLNGANLGVAAAQNVGIRLALARGASHIALFDHDSLPAPDMIARLLAAEKSARESMSARIAALGPACIDIKTGNMQPFIRLAGWPRRKIPAAGDLAPLQVDHLISSGSLLPAQALRDVGLMDESLFIDYVDIEWCLRARAGGYVCVGAPAARMNHRIGDAAVRLPLVRRHVDIHAPERHYFFYRNALWLYRRGYIPFWWKVQNGVSMLARLPFYLAGSPDRAQECRCILRGIAAGLGRAAGSAPEGVFPRAD